MKVFITGGTSGIGLELARHYIAGGHWVGVSGRDLAKLEGDPLAQSDKFVSYEGDVKNVTFMRETLEHFQKEVGPQALDLVVANAGRSVGNKSAIPDFSAGRDVMETNVFGVLNTFEPAVSIMRAQGSGQLVAISSVASFMGLPTASFYSASKAAVTRLCEAFSISLKDLGIDVTCICPGFIDTPLTQKNNHKMPFMISVEEAVKMMARAIEQKRGLYVFPWPMKLIITIMDKMPRWAFRRILGPKLIHYQRDHSH